MQNSIGYFVVLIALLALGCSDQRTLQVESILEDGDCIASVDFEVKGYADAPNSLQFTMETSEGLDSLFDNGRIIKYIIRTSHFNRSYHFPWKQKNDKGTVDLKFSGLFYKDPDGILNSEEDVINEFSSCKLIFITDKSDSIKVDFCGEPNVKFTYLTKPEKNR